MSASDVLVRLMGKSEAAVEQIKGLLLAMGLDVRVEWDTEKRGAGGLFDATLRIVNVQATDSSSPPEDQGGQSGGEDTGQNNGSSDKRGGSPSADASGKHRAPVRLVHDKDAKGFDRIKFNMRRRQLLAAQAGMQGSQQEHDPSLGAGECQCPICSFLGDDAYFSKTLSGDGDPADRPASYISGLKRFDGGVRDGEIERAIESIKFDPNEIQ